MESEAKKPKLDKDSSVATSTRSLTSICDWSNSEAVAIKHHEDVQTRLEISYFELAAAKLEVEKILSDVETSAFIGIAFDTPSYCLSALMLGIMSAGRAFVCLPSSNSETQKICDRLRVSHIFASDNISGLPVVVECQVHGKTFFLLRSNNFSSDLETVPMEKQIFAYAMTTSGSTGEPKLVRATHSSVVPNILDLKKILVVSNVDTVAQLTPVTFDPSVIEIFLSLSCGAALFTASQKLINDPKALLESIVKSRVTVVQSTPSLLTHRWSGEQLRQTILGVNSDLRILMLGGENFPSAETLARIKASGNGTRIFDVYGITEVSCWSCIREISLNDRNRVLGECLSETIVEARDGGGNVVEKGDGVLYIGSNTRICVIDDENIACPNVAVFRNTGDAVSIDDDGSITLKGRTGRRVKRYGTKMNPNELESHILKLSFVENCYALFVENNQSLHLFFTTHDKNLDEQTKLKHKTNVFNRTKNLSDVYHPDKIYLLDRFELNSNGKICKRFLTRLTIKSSTISRPEKNVKDMEKPVEIFANIWNRSLSSIEDKGFLDLGGNSIIALRIVAELSNESGREFPELVGRLLRNDNFHMCRSYVSGNLHENLSEKISEEIDGKKRSIRKNDESNIDEKFECENETLTTDTSNNSTKSDVALAWQKCRGKNYFPEEIESKNQTTWNNVAKIKLHKRYCLKKCVDASPTIFAYPGGKNYVTVGSHAGIICTAELSEETNADHWKIELTDRIEASVLVLNDFKAVVGTYDGYVYCLHLKTGEIFWKFKTGDAIKCTAIICSQKRNIFFGSYDHHAYCVSMKNGSKVWRVKVGNGSISATPCVMENPNCVIFVTLDGTCACLKQTNGEIIWRKKLDYPIFSAPVILTNEIVVVCHVSGELNGFSTSNGDKIWNVRVDGTVFSHLLVNKDPTTRSQSLIFASNNRKLYKFDFSSNRKSPNLRFVADCGASVVSTPWSNGKFIVVVGTDGRLKIFDFIDGRLLNEFKIDGDVFSSPILHENFIVVGCRDNYLYVLIITDNDER